MMEKEVYEQLPAVAVRAVVPIPHNEFRIEVGRENSLKALEVSQKEFNDTIVLLIQKDANVVDVKPSDMNSVGVLAKIDSKFHLPNGNYRVKFSIIKRLSITEVFDFDSYFKVNATELETIQNFDDAEQALMRTIVKELTHDPSAINGSEEVLRKVSTGTSLEESVDLIIYRLKSSNPNSKYRYLEEASLYKRMQYIIEDIEREKQIAQLENKINQDVKKSIDDSQKEYYLREKMKAIQSELGDKAKTEEEIEYFRNKIENAGMPKKIYDKAMSELKRYQQASQMMAESGIIRQYLEFLVALPWKNETVDQDDLVEVTKHLNENHYGLDKIKDRILEYLAVKIMTGKNPQTILCLYGPPGVGKTSLAKSIADALGRKFIKVSLGGISDESEIRGHRRTYIGALPGRILKGMKDAGSVNPVFLLDEIDKMASSYRGDPASAMLEVLDPEQNQNFSDNYLEENYDLSKVLFITTANTLDTIPAPLLDRMELIELSSYTEFEKTNIAYKHLIPKVINQNGFDMDRFSISNDAMHLIIEGYTREAGVRTLQRQIGTLVRKAIKEVLIEKKDRVDVTVDNLEHYLGKRIFFNNENREKAQVGVVTGLAYTQFGGDTLDIEVTYYSGKGALVLTGKLGDVMKESAMAALSYVKSHAKEYDIDPKLFTENDIHIHVPEGAVPKDGPSAGVTLTTAIVSALTNRAVDPHMGMTGEVTLRGAVLPIGGLREKAIAANRSGLKRIIIPFENQRDIDEIPQEVKDKLEIIPVHNVEEVLAKALK